MTLVTVCHAHSSQRNPIPNLLAEMRSVAAQLSFAKSRLAGLFSTSRGVVQEKLASARAHYYSKRYDLAAQQLLDLQSRPRIESELLRAEVSELLADTLLKLGFKNAAADASMTSVEQTSATRSIFEHRLLRALTLYRTPVETSRLNTVWQRYIQSLPEPSRAFSRLRYLYGRAVYQAGQLDRAKAIFSAVAASEQVYIKAQYFLGVINLKSGQFKIATEHFYTAAEQWDRANKTPETRKKTSYLNGQGLKSKLTIIKPSPLSDDALENAVLGASINLTLARLAMHDGNYDRAIDFYRRVPPGTTDSDTARLEYIQALDLLKEYKWAARSIRAEQTDGSITRLKLGLARARLLAKGQLFEASRDAFERAERGVDALRKTAAQSPETRLELALGKDSLIWHQITPESTRLSSELEGAGALLGELNRIAQSGQLPAVTQGQTLVQRIRKQIKYIAVHLDRLDPDQTYTEGGRTISALMLRQSLDRLKARLPGFDNLIDQYQRRFSGALDTLIVEEKTALKNLSDAVLSYQGTLKKAENALVKQAGKMLDQLESGAVLGQVNISFWKKEAVTERILELIEKQKNQLDNLEPEPDLSQTIMDLPAQNSDELRIRRQWVRAKSKTQAN